MKIHTTIGYDILKDRPLMEMAAEIAHYHQEKYNGTGYPNGFSGSEIPLSARITALADVYDALRSDRPYKGHEKAKDIIMAGRETHFDPDITDLFIRNDSVFEEIFEKMKDTN